VSCPHYCQIELSHVHETDGQWPHISTVAHRGLVEIHTDDGYVGAWLRMSPEDAVCLALEIQEQAMKAYEQARANS
jgi:hypothetical protein